MTCADFAAALLDERPLGAEAEAHLAGCAACRGVRAVHEEAQLLARADRVPSFEPVEVEALLRRRRRGRAALALGGVACAAAVALWLVSGSAGRQVAEPDTAPAMAQGSEALAPGSEVAGLSAAPEDAARAHREADAVESEPWPLERLLAAVDGYAARDLTVSDSTYAAFGDLAAWVAPPQNHSLEAAVFQRALAPIQFSQEEMP